MTGHICIKFTTTILGLHIYEYYSSNSSTSKHTDLTRVITSVCRQSTHVRGPVTASLVTLAIDVSVFVRTAWTCMCICSVVYALSRKFSPFSLFKSYYIVQYRRKNTVFVPSRLSAALLPFCAVAVEIYTLFHHVLQVFQSTFSPVTVQLRRAATELCNFDAKQSSLCCFDGFRTRYCWHKCRCLFS